MFYLLYFGRVILSSIQINHLIQSPFVALSANFFLFEGNGLQPLRHGKLPLGITIRSSLSHLYFLLSRTYELSFHTYDLFSIQDIIIISFSRQLDIS